jgi:hypothetical protein
MEVLTIQKKSEVSSSTAINSVARNVPDDLAASFYRSAIAYYARIPTQKLDSLLQDLADLVVKRLKYDSRAESGIKGAAPALGQELQDLLKVATIDTTSKPPRT